MKKFSLLWILILSVQIFAQDKIGRVNGFVYDSLGTEITDVTVKIIPFKNQKLLKNKSLSTITAKNGEFKFENIPFGLYELQLEVFWSDEVLKRRIKIGSQNQDEELFEFYGIPFKACSNISETKDLLTEKDKAEIVIEMLRNFNMDAKTKPIISTNKIKPQRFGNKRKDFIFMTDAAIQQWADTKGDFKYYRFSVFKTKGNCAAITLTTEYAQGENSKGFYCYEGKTYEFRKINGKWVVSILAQ